MPAIVERTIVRRLPHFAFSRRAENSQPVRQLPGIYRISSATPDISFFDYYMIGIPFE